MCSLVQKPMFVCCADVWCEQASYYRWKQSLFMFTHRFHSRTARGGKQKSYHILKCIGTKRPSIVKVSNSSLIGRFLGIKLSIYFPSLGKAERADRYVVDETCIQVGRRDGIFTSTTKCIL